MAIYAQLGGDLRTDIVTPRAPVGAKKKTFQHIREQYILFCYQESMSEKLQFINYWTEMRSQGHELNNWIQSCNANSPVRG